MPTSRYSPQLKAEAVARVLTAGYPHHPGAIAQVSRELDIPPATLHYWVRHPIRPVRASPHRAVPSISFAPSPTTTTNTPPLTTNESDTEAAPDPATLIDTTDMLTVLRAEIARILAELNTARPAAPYKDLITALRGLNEDVQKLEAQPKGKSYDPHDIATRLLAALDQADESGEASTLPL